MLLDFQSTQRVHVCHMLHSILLMNNLCVADAGEGSPLAKMQRPWNQSANWAPNIESTIYITTTYMYIDRSSRHFPPTRVVDPTYRSKLLRITPGSRASVAIDEMFLLVAVKSNHLSGAPGTTVTKRVRNGHRRGWSCVATCTAYR